MSETHQERTAYWCSREVERLDKLVELQEQRIAALESAARNRARPNRWLATIGVCALGALCMYVTDGNTGIGWAMFGVILIWW